MKFTLSGQQLCIEPESIQDCVEMMDLYHTAKGEDLEAHLFDRPQTFLRVKVCLSEIKPQEKANEN